MEIDRDLTGEFIKENSVTRLIILEEPVIPQGGFNSSVRARVECNDKNKTVGIWTLNKQSKNTMIDRFGTDTVKMVNNIIPVLAEPYGRGKYTINVDKVELLKKQTVLAK